MTRTSVVVSFLLAACASPPRPASVVSVPTVTHDSLRRAEPCVVGDTTAPSRDTLYVLGMREPSWSSLAQHCEQDLAALERPLVIGVTLPDGADYRDALDGARPGGSHRPDVVVTGDPDVVAYAARNPAFFVDTLPWGWRYVLASRGADPAWAMPNASERESLARDAVRGAARGAIEPFDWLTLPPCGRQAPWNAQAIPTVGYLAGDATAQQLAERIVALASSGNRPAWIPQALPPNARIVSIADQSPANDSVVARHAALVLAFRATAGPRCGVGGLAPLVDTRDFVIVRRGSGAAFIVGTDGTLWFVKRGAP